MIPVHSYFVDGDNVYSKKSAEKVVKMFSEEVLLKELFSTLGGLIEPASRMSLGVESSARPKSYEGSLII